MNMQITPRQQIENEIERLLAMLDDMDGDTDLEPSLGYNGPGIDEPWNDAEDACEDEGAQCDDEGDDGDNGICDLDGLLEQIRPVCHYTMGGME
jgi:succinate dehydrogenase/fumarate reductase flavoprotein subunit